MKENGCIYSKVGQAEGLSDLLLQVENPMPISWVYADLGPSLDVTKSKEYEIDM